MIKCLIAGSIIALASGAAAVEFDTDNLYLGGGLSMDSYGSVDAESFSFGFFAGIPLTGKIGDFSTAVEATYIKFSDAEVCATFFFTSVCQSVDVGSAMGASLVASMDLAPALKVMLRGGVLTGGSDGLDTGLQLGGGIAYSLSRKLLVRGEYFVAGDLDSLSFSLAYSL